MLVRPYEMPWRPAYELWAAAAWAGGLFYFVYLGGKGLLTASIALALAFLALLTGRPQTATGPRRADRPGIAVRQGHAGHHDTQAGSPDA